MTSLRYPQQQERRPRLSQRSNSDPLPRDPLAPSTLAHSRIKPRSTSNLAPQAKGKRNLPFGMRPLGKNRRVSSKPLPFRNNLELAPSSSSPRFGAKAYEYEGREDADDEEWNSDDLESQDEEDEFLFSRNTREIFEPTDPALDEAINSFEINSKIRNRENLQRDYHQFQNCFIDSFAKSEELIERLTRFETIQNELNKFESTSSKTSTNLGSTRSSLVNDPRSLDRQKTLERLVSTLSSLSSSIDQNLLDTKQLLSQIETEISNRLDLAIKEFQVGVSEIEKKYHDWARGYGGKKKISSHSSSAKKRPPQSIIKGSSTTTKKKKPSSKSMKPPPLVPKGKSSRKIASAVTSGEEEIEDPDSEGSEWGGAAGGSHGKKKRRKTG